MGKTRVLLAGESWVTTASHVKGWDQFASVTFHLGAEPLVAALEDSDLALTYMPAHEAASQFPSSPEALSAFDVVILSDIGANTLLLPPEVWLHGQPRPNRLKALRAWVEGGGGLIMIGGYFSFQGINGSARWRGTPVEEVLPVSIHPFDDRLEIPEGYRADILQPDHPVLAGLAGVWPLLLGAIEVTAKARPDVEVLARLPEEAGGHPLLVVGRHGRGRTAAWTSDIGPHWLPRTFSDWPGYARLWRQTLGWLAGGGR
jgi:uncharacterized membrane protein